MPFLFDAFVITFREIAELYVIVESIRLNARQQGRVDLMQRLEQPLVAGVCAAFALAALFGNMTVEKPVEAILTILFALAIIAMSVGMLSSVRSIRSHVQS